MMARPMPMDRSTSARAMNKTLKDFVVKSKNMAGFDSPYVPGWDCHGLPIEIKVDESLGGKKLQMDPMEVSKPAASLRKSFSTCSAPNSSGSGCLDAGKNRIPR